MHRFRSKVFALGLVFGVALTLSTALLMGQANQPVKSEPQYFVTAEGDGAHLWVREGATLRVVGHGQCAKCPMHKEGDGHDHDKAPVKK